MNAFGVMVTLVEMMDHLLPFEDEEVVAVLQNAFQEKGYIPVGDFCQTSVGGVFAIGDVVATPLLAHVASREGKIAVENVEHRMMKSLRSTISYK